MLKDIYFCYLQNANKFYIVTLLDFASNDIITLKIKLKINLYDIKFLFYCCVSKISNTYFLFSLALMTLCMWTWTCNFFFNFLYWTDKVSFENIPLHLLSYVFRRTENTFSECVSPIKSNYFLITTFFNIAISYGP